MYPDVPLPTHCPPLPSLPGSSGRGGRRQLVGTGPGRPARHRSRGCATLMSAQPIVEPHVPCVRRKVRGSPAAGIAGATAHSQHLAHDPVGPPTPAPKRRQRPSTPAAAWIGRSGCVACATLPEGDCAVGPADAECRDADEQKRAGEAGEQLPLVTWGAVVGSSNPASSGFPPAAERRGLPGHPGGWVRRLRRSRVRDRFGDGPVTRRRRRTRAGLV
jgi:hypothetical protein